MQLDTKKVALSEHAFKRLQERFSSKVKNKQDAINYVKMMLDNSEYIGIVPDYDGIDSHMFSFNNKVAIHISMDGEVVKTLYEIRVLNFEGEAITNS